MYYFAFASNLSRQQMAERAPGARIGQAAVLPNYKLVFSGWSRAWRGGTASIQASPGDKVMGGLYEVTEQEMARLDKYEGCPGEYKHTTVTVFPDPGGPVSAVTFIRARQLEESRPSAEYLARIREGYRDWGLI
jgi:gamma-glutamylcyclotransferase (GGCT)/AIG2-like uncharacterized protein YtfP